MKWSVSASSVHKDILIVVHNQYEFIKKCIDSLFANTQEFTLHIWDNGSDEKTANYLSDLSKISNVNLYRNESNIGFVIPNNIMAKNSNSDWILLLNSDTEVMRYWDEVLIGCLINNPKIAQVGFSGGILDERGKGILHRSGSDIDYICGYCFCISRRTYEKFGLFDDKNLKFAYCEDSDFSLRLTEAGQNIYACYSSDLVVHHGNKTTIDVLHKQKELLECAKNNINYMAKRWQSALLRRKNAL